MGRGHDRERAVKALLIEQGWWCIRAAASLGDADLVALKAGETPRFYEIKSTSNGGPFNHFGPKDRQDLLDAAQMAGAEAWLCWWPPRKDPQFIPSSEWPT